LADILDGNVLKIRGCMKFAKWSILWFGIVLYACNNIPPVGQLSALGISP